VSVVMPVLDEERHLAEAVRAVLDQRYGGPVQVALALGPSRDATDEVAAGLAAADPRVVLVPNPSGRTPEALNAAIKATSFPVVVRVDGHSVLDPDYVATAVDLLRRTGAANVGGIMHAAGTTPWERAVAAAMTSVLGVGSAPFHVGGSEGPADTVYLGVFRREWLDRVGGYDPEFVRAQDWEMNHRIRQSGGKIWFTPEMRVTYRPRPNLKQLAKQFFFTGRWRRVVGREHQGTLNLRYLAPPIAVVGIIVGTLAGAFGFWPGWILPAGYFLAIPVGGSLLTGSGLPLKSRLYLPFVYATMHLSWGLGFLTSPPGLGITKP
jgi:glycosyltransferase involved in cell wall biosynthesis